MSGAARDRLRGRVESHRAELKRLTQEFQSAKRPKEDGIEQGGDESWDTSITMDQRRRLLDNSDRIERTGRNLQNGYRMVLETEEIGSQVLKDLHDQRETIQRTRGRVGSSTFRLILFISLSYRRLFISRNPFFFSYEKRMPNLDEALAYSRG